MSPSELFLTREGKAFSCVFDQTHELQEQSATAWQKLSEGQGASVMAKTFLMASEATDGPLKAFIWGGGSQERGGKDLGRGSFEAQGRRP